MTTQQHGDTAHVHAIIIGSGFGGVGMAISLKKAGIDSFVVLEKASGVGGTWRDNTYPGAACDVQSHLYSYSFAPKHDWSRKFGVQSEILQYITDCATRFGVMPHMRFEHEVQTAVFDEATNQWTVSCANGTCFTAAIVITACGQLNQPAYPTIQGADSFQGEVFHSSRWNHDIDLQGKRVAVIGTGASAIQFVPRVVKQVSAMSLFQRSGAWVISKGDRPFKPYEQWAFKHIPGLDPIYRSLIYWKNESRAIAFTRFGFLLEAFALEAKWMARRQVKDADKRRQIIPTYTIGCKRVLMANDWYQAINDERVRLVCEDIAAINETGVVTADGQQHDADVIIYGTGFKATDFLTPIRVTGTGGVSLNEAWKDGAVAYKGISVAGFPNLFMLYGPNTNLAHSSIVFMLEAQIHYVMQCIKTMQARGLQRMDVKVQAQDQYSATIEKQLGHSVWESGCTSWYKTASGKNVINWPGFTFTFRSMTRVLDLKAYELS